MRFRTPLVAVAAMVAVLCWTTVPVARAADAAAAQALARQNNCFRCHGIDKGKDGPAWKEVAAKYRGKAEAEQRLITHLTTGEKAKFPDGHEEEHKIIKTPDEAHLKNLIEWILSL
jgi:cytochrome c